MGRWERVDVQDGHHPRAQVLRDVAMHHPRARIGGVDREDRLSTRRDDHRVLPNQVAGRDAVARDHEHPLPVQVHRVLHRMERVRIVEDAHLHDRACGTCQSMSMFSLPVASSRMIHRTCLLVDSQFMSGMPSIHSTGA